jgi:hypothetical protein
VTLSYSDNGNGTITDNNTCLTWEKKNDDGSVNDKDNAYTWAGAFDSHVAALNAINFAGRALHSSSSGTDGRSRHRLREALSLFSEGRGAETDLWHW